MVCVVTTEIGHLHRRLAVDGVLLWSLTWFLVELKEMDCMFAFVEWGLLESRCAGLIGTPEWCRESVWFASVSKFLPDSG